MIRLCDRRDKYFMETSYSIGTQINTFQSMNDREKLRRRRREGDKDECEARVEFLTEFLASSHYVFLFPGLQILRSWIHCDVTTRH